MTTLRKPVTRVSSSKAATYGPDRDKRLVVSIVPGPDGRDILELRPQRTQRVKRAALSDIYNWLIKCEANAAIGVKLAAAKAKKAERRAARKWKAEIRKANKEAV